MKHSIDELRARVYQLYPRGIWPGEPGYDDSEEHRRLEAARRQAGEDDATWRTMLDRIKVRFPECAIKNRSLHLCMEGHDIRYCAWLTLPAAMSRPEEMSRELGLLVSFVVPYYLIYSARFVYLPIGAEPAVRAKSLVKSSSDEQPHAQESTNDTESRFTEHEPASPADHAHYCIVYVDSVAALPDPRLKDRSLWREVRFELSKDEQPYARVIAEEIEAAFAGYEPMPPAIGDLIVPDVVAWSGDLSNSTLYGCLLAPE